MTNLNLPTELTTELDDVQPTYRDLLDPIFALSKDEIRKIAIFLQCVVEGVEPPDSLHEFLDAPRAKVEQEEFKFLITQKDGTEKEMTMAEYREQLQESKNVPVQSTIS